MTELSPAAIRGPSLAAPGAATSARTPQLGPPSLPRPMQWPLQCSFQLAGDFRCNGLRKEAVGQDAKLFVAFLL